MPSIEILVIETVLGQNMITIFVDIQRPQSTPTNGLSALDSRGADDIKQAVLRIAGQCLNGTSETDFILALSDWMREDLELNLNELAREPFNQALEWNPGSNTSSAADIVRPLAAARACLIDLEAIASTNNSRETVGAIRQSAQRIESALVALSAWQTATLEDAAQKIARIAARTEESERSHQRKIGDLGAFTLFPMLLFAFLGSNILPEVEFGFKLNGTPVLVCAIAAAFGIAWFGRAWIRKTSTNPSDEETRNES